MNPQVLVDQHGEITHAMLSKIAVAAVVEEIPKEALSDVFRKFASLWYS